MNKWISDRRAKEAENQECEDTDTDEKKISPQNPEKNLWLRSTMKDTMR
jgi:hypothetical protein